MFTRSENLCRCATCNGLAEHSDGRCYTPSPMFAQKLIVEIEVDGTQRPCPLDWLDAFCMRNFTGSGEFDDTLSVAEGRIEAGASVKPDRLAAALSEWLTTRGKGNGRPVQVTVRPVDRT